MQTVLVTSINSGLPLERGPPYFGVVLNPLPSLVLFPDYEASKDCLNHDNFLFIVFGSPRQVVDYGPSQR